MLWIVSLFVVYLLVLFAIAWISLHPFRIPTYLSPGSLGAAQENIAFESDGNTLRGWWVPAEESDAVMIFSHGYMMNKCEFTPDAAYWSKHGISGLLFDHRAHGHSGGKVCCFGVHEQTDIVAAVRFAREKKPGAKIILVGSSMGSASIAFALAKNPDLADLVILDSCYSRLGSASLGWWRFLGGKFLMFLLSPTVIIAAPMVGFNPFKVDVAKAVGHLSHIPVLFLHGNRDTLALPSEAERNIAAHAGSHTVVWFDGCGHSEARWIQPDKYQYALGEFLQENGIIRASDGNHGTKSQG